MAKFRKKPVVIDAVELMSFPGVHGYQVPNWKEIEASFGKRICAIGNNVNGKFECLGFNITTLEGTMFAAAGDWIITGVKGELYPCKPDIFAATYEPV